MDMSTLLCPNLRMLWKRTVPVQIWCRYSQYLLVQIDHSCAPAARLRRGIAKTPDKRTPGQHGAHNLALDANPTAVNDAQGTQSESMRFNEVFLHNGLHVPRRDCVKIEHVCDGNAKGIGVVEFHAH